MDSKVKHRMLEIFENHREQPGAPFDDDHFLDFLISEPKYVGAVKNSFKGLRRFNKFIDDVQFDFGVCFSVKDRESSMSVDKFADRIEKLMCSRSGSLRSLKNQERGGTGWTFPALFWLILVSIAIGVRDIWWLSILLIAVALVITGFFINFSRSETQYRRRLRSRIEAHEKSVA